MSTETLPRWGLPAVDFLQTDPAAVESEIITSYERASGRKLAAGDPVRLFLLSIAAIIIQQRLLINTAAQQNILTYAQGEYLDALGALLSVERLQPAKAVTTIRFTLSQELASVYSIPAGTQVTNGVVVFATNTEIQIPIGETTGEVTASCTEPGVVGNDYLAGQINQMVSPLTFVSEAENISTSAGGAEIESDADYAERIRLAPNGLSVAGPEAAYVFHAKSVSSSIVDVSVDSPTPGDVDVYVLLEGGELPSEEVLAAVLEHLSADEIRPLTDHVTAKSPTAVNYEIKVEFWINKADATRAASIQAAVERAVEDYRLWQQSKIGRDISPERLLSAVVQAGASRVDSSTLLPKTFQTLVATQVAQCTKVTVNYKGYKDE